MSIIGCDMAESTGKKRSKNGILIAGMGFIIAAVVVGVSFGSDIIQWFAEEKLREGGESATAEVVDLVDTGNRYNSNPQVEITLKVTDSSGKTWSAKTRKILSAVDVIKYQPGTKLRVLYDPQEPTTVLILGPM